MNVENLSAILPDILAECPEISLVYLFGSRVSGQVGPMSDVDLAILCASTGDEYQVQARFQHALVVALQTDRVDVVLVQNTPIELAYNIISRGIVLYQRDLATRVEFEAQVLGKYGDYLPVLHSFYQQIKQGDPYARRTERYREALRRTRRTLSQARTPEGQEPG